MTPYQKAFGQIVREQREEVGLNQRQLARQVPVTPLVILQIENGTFVPPIETLDRLAVALKTDVSTLAARATLLFTLIQRGETFS